MRKIVKIISCPFLCFTLLACNNCKGNVSDESTTNDSTEIAYDVTTYSTNTTRSLDLTESGVNFGTGSNMSPTTVTLKPDQRYQTMDGFGAALTGSTCYNLMHMPEKDRAQFLQETFDTINGFGFSYVRISIGASDFSLSEYTCCDTKEITNFALQSDEINYVIPILKEVLAINPSLKIIGSPWTCPKWMKVNNLTDLAAYDSWTSGQLNPAYYNDYATYFVKWIQALGNNGIPITAITVQNEPLNRGNSVSLYMTWEEERDFVKVLGPALKNAGLLTKIYVYDHNYDYDGVSSQEDYPIHIYNDSIAAKYVTGAAYHNYGGSYTELLNIHNQRSDKDLIFTEASIGEWNDGRNLETRLLDDMEDLGFGTITNWCKAVIVWNLMLDENEGPNRPNGCTTCYGAVDIKTDYATITRNSQYYVIAHLSSVIKPGATRIGTNGYTTNGISYMAFENPDSTYSVVVMNKNSDSQKITFSDDNHYFSYNIPADAIVSCLWHK